MSFLVIKIWSPYQRWAQITTYQKRNRNKAQRSFQPVKAHRKMRNLIFLISELQRSIRNELFDSVKALRSSAIVERQFCTKLK